MGIKAVAETKPKAGKLPKAAKGKALKGPKERERPPKPAGGGTRGY